tara:strand:- start:4429 stop:6507 length:2079 start_codon:yes stop_codon:yes gene_type:complete
MKILLLYPPDRAFPATPYSSLPTLAPCLKEAGHEVVLRDVSLEVFETLANEKTLLEYHRRRTTRLRELESMTILNPEEEDEYRGLYHTLAIPRKFLENVSAHVKLMRDSEKFYEPEQFGRSWDALRGVIRFYNGPNPVPSPNYPDLIDRTSRALNQKLNDDPVVDVYRQGLIDSLLEEKPDLIGVSIPFITSYYEGMRLVRFLKQKSPGTPVVVGGSLIDTYHDPMISDPRVFDWFEYGMYGECDKAFPELANALERGDDLSNVPNLYYRDAKGMVRKNEKRLVENLDAMPTPDFDGLLMDKYLSPEPVASFQTSRGCYYGKCTFCSLSFRDNFRLRNPKKVVEDMLEIHSRTGARMFLLWDSLSPPKTLRAVAKEIKNRKLGFYFFAETKFEKTYLDRGFIRDLAEGGCRFLQFGMESASERILDFIDKGNKMSEVDRMLENMAEFGIHTSLTWFIGFPTETQEEAKYSYDFIEQRRHKVTLSSYTGVYNLLPDQPLFYDQETYGIEIHQNEEGGYYFTYKDGSRPFDTAEMDQACLVRGDAELLKHGGYMPYSALAPERLPQLTGSRRMGPLACDVADWPEAEIQRTKEVHITRFGRDPSKDFKLAPTSVKLVYHHMTGNVYRLLGKQIELLEAVKKPIKVRSLREKLDMDWDDLYTVLCHLTNRGLVRFIEDVERLRAKRYRVEATVSR